MKHNEYAIQLETYDGLTAKWLHYHKSGDVEGARIVTRYNLVITLFGRTYWFSVLSWSKRWVNK